MEIEESEASFSCVERVGGQLWLPETILKQLDSRVEPRPVRACWGYCCSLVGTFSIAAKKWRGATCYSDTDHQRADNTIVTALILPQPVGVSAHSGDARAPSLASTAALGRIAALIPQLPTPRSLRRTRTSYSSPANLWMPTLSKVVPSSGKLHI